MRVAAEVGVPRIDVQTAPERLTFRAELELGALSDLPRGAWRLGLSAVIEEAGGRKSYWALAHPQGKPDFHHADGFACESLLARRLCSSFRSEDFLESDDPTLPLPLFREREARAASAECVRPGQTKATVAFLP